MQKRKVIVSVFGSSRPGPGEPEYQIAFELGKQLAGAGFVVCNGGYGGTMEASARGAKEARGKTIGITCEFFGRAPNSYIDETIVVKTLNERLTKLVEMGDAYIILKGGTGTLLELATVWEYMNKRIMKRKPIIVLGMFWSPVVTTLKDELMWEGSGIASEYVVQVPSSKECVEVLREKLESL